MALMKRKLPSKLTQEDPFATADDAFALQEPKRAPKSEASSPKSEAPVDVFVEKEETVPPVPQVEQPEISDEPEETPKPVVEEPKNTPAPQQKQASEPPRDTEKKASKEVSPQPKEAPQKEAEQPPKQEKPAAAPVQPEKPAPQKQDKPQNVEERAPVQSSKPEEKPNVQPSQEEKKAAPQEKSTEEVKTVHESSLKRKVKRRRRRSGSTPAFAASHEQAEAQTTPQAEGEPKAEEKKEEKEVDVTTLLGQEEAATKVANSLADIRGEFDDVSEEASDPSLMTIPTTDLSGPTSTPLPPMAPTKEPEPAAPSIEPAAEAPQTPAPQQVVEAPKAEAPILPPPSFAETTPPVEEAPSDAAPTPTFEAPKPFAEEVKPAPEPAPKGTGLDDIFSAPPSMAEQPTAESSSPLPSPSKDDAWDFSAFVGDDQVPPMGNAPIAPDPMGGGDIFGSASLDDTPISGGSRKDPPPELPSSPEAAIGRMTGGENNSNFVKLGVVVLLVGAIVGGVFIIRGGDKAREGLEKYSDTVADYHKEIPADETAESVQDLEQQMEKELASMNAEDVPLAPPAVQKSEASQQNTQGTAPQANAQIDFVDVDPSEAAEPIVADDSEDMPEDISAIARLQKEIARLKGKKGEGDKEPQEVEEDVVTDKAVPTKAQIDAELEAYRKALVAASSPDELPAPETFLKGQPKQSALKTPQEVTTPGPNGLPPSTAYTENPYDLPVIPEPDIDETNKVRTLNDFDLALFEPEEDHVRIPKGVRPRLSATDFPMLDVLSFVPDRGVIATNRGRQGVLLLGESVEGWELVGVYDDYAEFRNGTRQYVLTRKQD